MRSARDRLAEMDPPVDQGQCVTKTVIALQNDNVSPAQIWEVTVDGATVTTRSGRVGGRAGRPRRLFVIHSSGRLPPTAGLPLRAP